MKLVTEEQLTALVNRIKDKFAKKDTGWYDITALVAMPSGAAYTYPDLNKVLLRRIDNTVYVAFSYFGWNVSGAGVKNWFPPEICEYIAPPLMSNGRQIRMAGIVAANHKAAISHFYQWISATEFWLTQNQTNTSQGIMSWMTDTPFPTNPKGVKI